MADIVSEQTNTVDLRAQVFERLNTGGEKLNHQELRNCLYSGTFNQLVVDLSGWAEFTAAWGIPNHKDNTLSDGSIANRLKQNQLYSTMGDCQIILRFFAFRTAEKIVGSTKNILDTCMKENRHLPKEKITELRQRFTDVFMLCKQVFGEKAFRLPAEKGRGNGPLSRPLYDAEIVALDHLYDHAQKIKDAKSDIRRQIAAACDRGSSSYELIVGRPNTARAIKQRIEVVENIIRESSGA